MKTKNDIVKDWLTRYTKRELDDFTQYVLLTNFNSYVDLFSQIHNVPVLGKNVNFSINH